MTSAVPDTAAHAGAEAPTAGRAAEDRRARGRLPGDREPGSRRHRLRRRGGRNRRPVSTLQYYFGSREDLLVAAFRYASRTEIAELEAEVAGIADPSRVGSSGSSRGH